MEYDKLKKILCTEIDETIDNIMREGKMSMGDLEILDKLTHAYKSTLTSKAMEDTGYSYNDGYSGARRRDNMGRYTDSGYSNRYYDGEYSGRRYYDGYSGRMYSRDDGKSYMIEQFEKLMKESSNPEEHEVLQSAINRLKNM